MKTRFLILLTTLLMLVGVSANAQYYWYVGTTEPTAENISTIATGSETSKPDWSEPQSIKATNNTGESAYLYYCFPTDWNIRILDSDKTTEMSLAQEGTFTYDGISYTVQRTGRKISNGNSKDFYATTTAGEPKYYWYAGPDMLTSTTIPGSGTVYPMTTTADSQIGWHIIDGEPTSIETGDLANSEKINWTLAVPTSLGLNHVSNGEDVTDLYTVSTVTCADGVSYKVFRQIETSKRIAVIFVKGSSDETKYYWYAGPDMLTSETVPGTNEDNECSYGWHVITGNPTSIETGELGTSDCPKINWVLAVPTKFGLTRISNGEDVTDAYEVSTVTTADGVEYTVFRQISQSKRTGRAFVDGETKYYWYYGTTLPTEENLTSIAGWSEDYPYGGFYLGLRAKLYNDTELSADMYICTPAIYKNQFVWKDAGGAVDLIDVSTFTCGSIEYKVQKLASPLGAGEKKYIYAMEPYDNITMSIDKSKAFLEKNHTMTLKATLNPTYLEGYDSNNSMTWKSSNTAVATVSKSGEVTGLKAGTATITCTSNVTGLSTTCTVTVGYVKLDQPEVSLEKGKTLTLTATVYPSSLKDKTVTWESSNTAVATVTSAGKVKGVKSGTATITCTSKETGLKTTSTVTVGYVKLDQPEVSLEKGKTLTLTATVYPSSLTDKTVTWESSNTAVATVTSAGKVKGVKSGTATITCTSKATGLKTTSTVTVGYVKLDKTDAKLEKGKTLTLTATVYPSALTDKSVTWKSSDTNIATVSTAGKVKGVKSGTATITCTSKATGLKTTCTVTVGYVKLEQTEVSLEKGKTLTLKATVYPSALTDKSVTWKSSDTKIATVSTAGKVKGVKAGTATITCTSKATGLKTTCTVTVGYVKLDKTEATLLKGKTVTLTATVYPSSLTDKSVTWKSSDTKIATVSSAGKVTAVKAGKVTITCTSKATGLKTTCTVTVENGKVTLDKTEVRVQKGKTVTLKATVTPSSLKDKSVTWKSSNTKIATVTADGKVKGIKAGTATITCTSNATGKKATCTVTVLQSMVSLPFNGEEMMEDQNGVEEPFDVYDLNGHMVKSQVTSLDGLPNGIYIVNGKKILKK